MTDRFCIECHRLLDPTELAHLHLVRFYDADAPGFWTRFPGTALLAHFDAWLRDVHHTRLLNDDLPFLPPAVDDHERLVAATAALRLALGLPHVRSLLDLLDALLVRLGEEASTGALALLAEVVEAPPLSPTGEVSL